MNCPVTAIYFSPTGTSRKGACAIAEALGGTCKELDLTCHAVKAQFGSNEVVFFRCPGVQRSAVQRHCGASG